MGNLSTEPHVYKPPYGDTPSTLFVKEEVIPIQKFCEVEKYSEEYVNLCKSEPIRPYVEKLYIVIDPELEKFMAIKYEDEILDLQCSLAYEAVLRSNWNNLPWWKKVYNIIKEVEL
jgi:hypothetical protein